ncbi:dehydrase and lipid transport-domain-containing protein [Hysterangium stoloniferum]|nr:dehydrase and lipid transport-domain-containing protein [Hysterangium stoloniferum]
MLRLLVREPISQVTCRSSVRHRTIFNALGFSSGSDSEKNRRYHERKILPYRQSQLYDVVADVDAYRHFIPYCTASRVLQRTRVKPANEDAEILKMQGELTVGFMGYEERYISDVECRPHEMVQAIASSEIPLFKSLVTTWRFQPASPTSPHPTRDVVSTLKGPFASDNEPTLVTFDLEYEFANPLHAHLSAAFFGKVSKMMIHAFEERCLDIYGPGTQ